MIIQIMIKLTPNFDMAYKTIQRVSVPNLKLFVSIKTELWAKKVEEFSVMLDGKMGWGHSFAHQHRCRKRSSEF